MLSDSSREKLKQCHPLLQDLVNKASKFIPLVVVCGFRGESEQNKAYEEGKSKVKFPDSKHNKQPSLAVDLAILSYGNKICWTNDDQFRFLGGVLTGIYYQNVETFNFFGFKLRWGGDWDGDFDASDWDPGHFELVENK